MIDEKIVELIKFKEKKKEKEDEFIRRIMHKK